MNICILFCLRCNGSVLLMNAFFFSAIACAQYNVKEAQVYAVVQSKLKYAPSCAGGKRNMSPNRGQF